MDSQDHQDLQASKAQAVSLGNQAYEVKLEYPAHRVRQRRGAYQGFQEEMEQWVHRDHQDCQGHRVCQGYRVHKVARVKSEWEHLDREEKGEIQDQAVEMEDQAWLENVDYQGLLVVEEELETKVTVDRLERKERRVMQSQSLDHLGFEESKERLETVVRKEVKEKRE